MFMFASASSSSHSFHSHLCVCCCCCCYSIELKDRFVFLPITSHQNEKKGFFFFLNRFLHLLFLPLPMCYVLFKSIEVTQFFPRSVACLWQQTSIIKNPINMVWSNENISVLSSPASPCADAACTYLYCSRLALGKKEVPF